MKYKSIAELDKAIENRINRIVKHYKTDWTEYDKPKYERLKKSKEAKERQFTLIVRECGTWLVTEKEKAESIEMQTVYEYYKEQEPATYYDVDIDKLSILKQRG